MNILILSAGTRNKIVRYFRETIRGRVIATDMSSVAPAIYEADSWYIVPPIHDPGYLDRILDICRKEKADAVLSLIDPELSLLAANEEKFAAEGVRVIGSSYELCEMSLDKMQMYRFCRDNGFPCARSYDSIEPFLRDLEAESISFPVFVKPVRGSASLSVSKVSDRETLDFLFRHTDGLMIQEYLDGQEIGADVYIDMLSGEIVSIFTRKKLLMRSGETDKAVSFRDERLFAFIEKFVNCAGYRGEIDIDLFEVDGEYYISEVNPRFGGGYPHAYECGWNHMKLIEKNVNGIVNEKTAGWYEEGVYMMKYCDLMIRREHKKPEISVIMPCYNVGRFVRESLECLVHQTLQNMEIIIVNDGSTDDTLSICEEYAGKDPRIRLFSKKNGGLSDARNYGLERASADVVGFVDSDDTFDLDFFEHLLKIKKKAGAQMAVGGIKMTTEDGVVYKTRSVSRICVKNRHDTIEEVLYSKRVANAVWNKIFDRNLFDEIRFPVGRYWEDAHIIFELIHRTTRTAFTNRVFYYYRTNPEGISKQSFTPRELDRVYSSLNKVEFMKKHYPDLVGLAEQYVVYDCIMAMSKMKRYDHQYDDLLVKNVRKYIRSYIKGDRTPEAKAFAAACTVSPDAAVVCYQLLKKVKK